METQMERRRASALQEHHQFLKTAEVARLLHVSPKTIARWAKDGHLPYQRTLGGHRRYPESAIRELAASLAQEASAS
ncbi:MAG: helix-turn-helix domain-containing protein [Actinomycetota bacterium]